MIARIIVGSGSNRTDLTMVRDKDTRRTLAGKIKSALFPSNAAYGQAKRRGERSLSVAS